jgi:hypothetical protein
MNAIGRSYFRMMILCNQTDKASESNKRPSLVVGNHVKELPRSEAIMPTWDLHFDPPPTWDFHLIR